MGVAVLNPQDCLRNPLSYRQSLITPPPRMKSPRNPNPNQNQNQNRPNRSQPNRRKRISNASPTSRAAIVAPQAHPRKLLMGQVKILKRGEQLAEVTPEKVLPLPAKVEEKRRCRSGIDSPAWTRSRAGSYSDPTR
uniref:Uncharacterized protein n=1 Tax=Jatropha curcas TaxID=180498 RepID=E1U346_JATCU